MNSDITSSFIKHAGKVIIIILFLSSLSLAAQDTVPPITPGLAKTPAGNFFVYYRTPASAEDLGMPIPEGNTILDSLVYRVRDRQQRDLLFLARLRIECPLTAQQALAIYLPALGAGVTRENDLDSGEISLAAGVAADLRLVTITPHALGTILRLERLQKFTLPPRIFNDTEKKVVTLLAQVANNYHQQTEISYAIEQQAVLDIETPAAEKPVPLTWQIRFRLPLEINLTAVSDGVEGLRISSKDNQLFVKRQTGEEEIREIGTALSLDVLPELADDPVSGMVLGESLVNSLLDELKMEKLTTPDGEQAKITLHYPDTGEILTIMVDMRNKQVISAKTVSSEDEQTTTIIRRYYDYKLKR